jgi:GT2 family glycosyltransferase
MKLSIITVSWNVKDYLLSLISSILKYCNELEFEFILVDNNSKDGTVEEIKRKFSKEIFHKKIRIIANNENLGFSKANNQGFRIARGEYICFMNPDMTLIEDSFSKLLRYFKQEKYTGLLACQLLFEDLSIQPTIKSNPALLDQIIIMLKFHHFCKKSKSLNNYWQKDFDYCKISKVKQIMGAFVMARKSTLISISQSHSKLDNKPWDESYWLWWEDVELCKAAQALNIPILYWPKTQIIHFESKSFAQIEGYGKHKRFLKGLLNYFKKHQAKWQYLLLLLLSPISIMLAILSSILGFKPKPQSSIK